jgi:hypothetical protein
VVREVREPRENTATPDSTRARAKNVSHAVAWSADTGVQTHECPDGVSRGDRWRTISDSVAQACGREAAGR